jgi:hypothetical protein
MYFSLQILFKYSKKPSKKPNLEYLRARFDEVMNRWSDNLILSAFI